MVNTMNMTLEDRIKLNEAQTLLESQGLASHLNRVLGSPVEKGFRMLPDSWQEIVENATEKALKKALEFSIHSLDGTPKDDPSNLFHKTLAASSGAFGGAFGIFSLPVELPVSTVIMLRSIADIARSEKANIHLPETKLSCLEVFALGAGTASDGNKSNYYITRTALAQAIGEAAEYIATRGLVDEAGSVVVRLLAAIGAKFGVMVSEKVAASAIPLVGAASGALINTIFMDYFQTLAKGHFIIKRLERKYGQEHIQNAYQHLCLAS
ncbi:MAG: EcsC family protein [SAR324 cluster bacterium]|nr:EcsC family protein [SAR324 cluster bacterium]